MKGIIIILGLAAASCSDLTLVKYEAFSDEGGLFVEYCTPNGLIVDSVASFEHLFFASPGDQVCIGGWTDANVTVRLTIDGYVQEGGGPGGVTIMDFVP